MARTYRGRQDEDGHMRVVVSERLSPNSLVRIRQLGPPRRTSFAVGTGVGAEALARALCGDVLGARRITQDPGLYLEFLFAVVAHLDSRAWLLTEADIRAATADPITPMVLARPGPMGRVQCRDRSDAISYEPPDT